MAYRTIYGKPEGAHAIKVRETETRNPAFIVPFKIYDAVDLQNGKYLIKDETGRFFEYDAERFEVLSGEDVRHLKKSVRYQKHRCPAAYSMLPS